MEPDPELIASLGSVQRSKASLACLVHQPDWAQLPP